MQYLRCFKLKRKASGGYLGVVFHCSQIKSEPIDVFVEIDVLLREVDEVVGGRESEKSSVALCDGERDQGVV